MATQERTFDRISQRLRLAVLFTTEQWTRLYINILELALFCTGPSLPEKPGTKWMTSPRECAITSVAAKVKTRRVHRIDYEI